MLYRRATRARRANGRNAPVLPYPVPISTPNQEIPPLNTEHRALALALAHAHRSGTQLPSAGWSVLERAEDAYGVSDAVAAEMGWWQPGEVARHWKSGGASRKAALSHSALPPGGVRGDGADLSDMRFHSPGIEGEIALRLGRDVTPEAAAQLTEETARPLIDAMTVAAEIADSRFVDSGQAPALARLADNQSHGALVLGAWTPYAQRDWPSQDCDIRIGDAAPQRHIGTHSLDDPAWLLAAWLRHMTRHGATVPAGTVVTTGSWNGVAPVQRGTRVQVDFAGIGTVQFRL